MATNRHDADPRENAPDKPDIEDTASYSLSRTDRKKLGIDSWEPSLLRKLLKAQNRLNRRK